MHWSHGLQGSLKRRYKHPSPTSINGYHTAKKLLSQSPAKRPTFAFADESGYTLAFANRIAHSGLHAETGALRTGVVSLPSDRSARFGNPAWPGGRAANFAVFGSWPGVLPKNAKRLRDSDALMRVAVPRRRGPAGLRDPFSSVEIVACMPCAQGLSACARHGRYHYPRRALRAAETPDGRLSKRLTCRFLRSGEQRSLRSAYFFRIYRIFCRQFQLQTLLRYGTINPRNWKNFRTIMPLNSRLQLQVPHRGHAPNNRKEVLSHEETYLLGSGSPPVAEPCRLRGKLRFQSIICLIRTFFFIFNKQP